MSSHIITLDEKELHIDHMSLPVEELRDGKRRSVELPVDRSDRDRILAVLLPTENADFYICCYTNADANRLYVRGFSDLASLYSRFVRFAHRGLRYRLKGRYLCLSFWGRPFSEKYRDLNLEKMELVIDDNHRIPIPAKLNSGYRFYSYKIPIADIVSQETKINNPLHMAMHLTNGVCFACDLMDLSYAYKDPRFYYIPHTVAVCDDWVLYTRTNGNRKCSLVVRPREDYEKTEEFERFENSKISRKMFREGSRARRKRTVNVNLFYEKKCNKSDEGAFEVFCRAREYDSSENYFILNRESADWDRRKNEPGVVEQYSEQYYHLLYTANNFIATESSAHLNILRSANVWLRRALLNAPLVFMQHGVTYLKPHEKNSVLMKGKEGEAEYVITGSEAEANVVSRMMKVKRENCLITGLPVFDTVPYHHIDENAPDIVTVMLTRRQYEEHMISHFEDSSYYRYTRQVFDLLQKCVPADRIRIVPHPMSRELLLTTDLKDAIYNGTVSDAIASAKCLITDYSSVCYNAYYQGAGVIFYQPDLAEYESHMGTLIPQEDEYIGPRCFTKESLEEILRGCMAEGRIWLSKLRDAETDRRYHKINSFCDGRNAERIAMELHRRGIL